MLEIKAAYYTTLIERLDDLLNDLNISNPEYRIASDLAQNPIITSLTKELRKNPLDCVVPTRKGVIFHIVASGTCPKCGGQIVEHRTSPILSNFFGYGQAYVTNK